MWAVDESWATQFELDNNTVSIINPTEGNPLNETISLYVHGGVSVKCTKLFKGLVFRVADMVIDFNFPLHCYKSLYNTFDREKFSSSQ